MVEGAITYPRTYGKRRRPAWTRGNRLYLTIASREVIIEFVEWTFKLITYLKRSAPQRTALRREFETRYRSEFLKHLAANERAALEAAGFSATEIDEMARGVRPRGYSVHHKLPLDDGGDNSFANLVLIRESPEHAALTAYQISVTRGLRDGHAREVGFPLPKLTIVVYPPTNDPPTTLVLWPRKEKR